MLSRERVLDVVSPVAMIFPGYHLDAADINEALDDGVASCASRAFASGILLRDAYPNENLYEIKFGVAPEHATEYTGKNGDYVGMGHCVVSFCVPGSTPWIVDSYTDSTIEVVRPSEEHEGYEWAGLEEGYRAYLANAELGDVEVNTDELLAHLVSLGSGTSQVITT